MTGRNFRYPLCLVLLFSMLWLTACTSSSQAPVTDKSAKLARYQSSVSGPPPKYGRYYTVRKGDTLYSIAWAIKQDYRKVAQWNGIHKPYTIYVGQRLRLFPHKTSAPPKQVAKKTTSSRKPVTGPPKSATTSRKPPPSTRTASKPSPPPSSSHSLGPVRKWRWPTRSHKVHERFSPDNGQLGIDITGRKGDGVYAAADGQIVYAGSGLRGYGKLIIVKHNNTYLSAYAHNSRILVSEGEYVKSGKKIAEMGNGGGSRYKLHFEIRKKGKPVNPLKYLPRS